MSDERGRELERRWSETGAVEDGAACLAERARRGDLSFERLEIAASCGCQPAIAVLGRECPLESVRAWATRIVDGCGREGAVRALLSVARLVAARLPAFDSAELELFRTGSVATLHSVDQWLATPDARTRLRAIRTHDRSRPWAQATPRTMEDRQLGLLRHVLRRMVEALGTGRNEDLPRLLSDGIGLVWHHESEVLGAGFVDRALSEEFLPWLLGSGCARLSR
jgi:hypothetical protein